MFLQLGSHRCDSECMSNQHVTLSGSHVRLEPLESHHIDSLVAAAAGDPFQAPPLPAFITAEGYEAAKKNPQATEGGSKP